MRGVAIRVVAGAASELVGRLSASSRRPFGAFSVAAAAALLVYLAALGGIRGEGRVLAANLTTFALCAGAAAMALRAARTPSLGAGARRGWMLLAIGYGLVAVGDLTWLAYESVLGLEPYPSPADAAYLLSYPVVLLGLLSFPPRMKEWPELWRFWLDIVIVGLSAAMALWYFILEPTLAGGGAALELAADFLYPVGDLIVLMGLAGVLLRKPPRRLRLPLALVAVSVGLELAGDLRFSLQEIAGTYATAGLADFLWASSYALLIMAADAQRRLADLTPTEDESGSGLRRFSPIPYASVAAAFLLLGVVALGRDYGVLSELIVIAALLTAAVTVRQLVSVRENAHLEALAATRRSEDRFRALVQNASDLITILDRRGSVVYASDSLRRTMGLDPACVVGKRGLLRVHPEDREEANAFLERVLEQSGEPVEGAVFRLQRADGEWRRFEHTGMNLLRSESIRGIVLNSRDVTDREALEAQLRQSQKLEAVGRLAGGVAHDFNNILTALQGHTRLLLDGAAEGSGERDELLEIERSAERAAELTRQLLAFSRKQVVRPRWVDLTTLVHGMERMLERIIGEDVRLTTALPAGSTGVRADPGQLEQVLMNLVINARDAMPGGGDVLIAVSNRSLSRTAVGRPDAEAGTYARIQVRDTGEGMDDDTRAKIFEPFFTTKRAGHGTGLGLASVHAIIDQAGGWIEVQSHPGRGSVFSLYLPQAERDGSEEEEEKHDDHARHRRTEPRAAPSAARLLLVEDEDAVRKLIERVLKGHGYDVRTAATAESALASLDPASHLDLLITDVVMPGKSGTQLAAALQRTRPTLRTLYMSGYTEDEIIRRGLQRPDFAFIEKPFSPDVLLRKVRDVLDSDPPAPAERDPAVA